VNDEREIFALNVSVTNAVFQYSLCVFVYFSRQFIQRNSNQ